MISLAGRDIAHSWSKFVLTGIGLGLLIGVEIDADVAHLGVQAGELERVIHVGEQKGTLVVALELNAVVQVDGSIARRSEEVAG